MYIFVSGAIAFIFVAAASIMVSESLPPLWCPHRLSCDSKSNVRIPQCLMNWPDLFVSGCTAGGLPIRAGPKQLWVMVL